MRTFFLTAAAIVILLVAAAAVVFASRPAEPTYESKHKRVFAEFVAPDQQTIRAVAVGKTFHVWAMPAGHPSAKRTYRALGPFAVTQLHSKEVNYIAFNPTGESIAAVCDDGRVALINPSNGDVIDTRYWGDEQNDGNDQLYSVAWAANSRRLATAGEDGFVREWEVTANSLDRLGRVLRGHESRVRTVAYHPFRTGLVASGSTNPAEVRLWDLVDKSRSRTMAHEKAVRVVAFSPDGKLLASACYDGSIRLFEASGENAGSLLQVLEDHASPVTALAFSPDGKRLVSGAFNGKIFIWDVESRIRLTALGTDNNLVTSLSWNADGNVLAVTTVSTTKTGIKGSLRFFDTVRSNYKQLGDALLPHGIGNLSTVHCAVFSPSLKDKTLLATSGEDGTVRLFDVTFGERLGATVGGKAAFATITSDIIGVEFDTARDDGLAIRVTEADGGKTTVVTFKKPGSDLTEDGGADF